VYLGAPSELIFGHRPQKRKAREEKGRNKGGTRISIRARRKGNKDVHANARCPGNSLETVRRENRTRARGGCARKRGGVGRVSSRRKLATNRDARRLRRGCLLRQELLDARRGEECRANQKQKDNGKEEKHRQGGREKKARMTRSVREAKSVSPRSGDPAMSGTADSICQGKVTPFRGGERTHRRISDARGGTRSSETRGGPGKL